MKTENLQVAIPSPPDLSARYRAVRGLSEKLCEPLAIEDYCVQSMPEASPTKWHLAHTTWFFETFVLEAALPDYEPFHPRYGYLFNSYYNALGEQFPRAERGLLSRPTVAEVMAYRAAVDAQMAALLERRPWRLDEPLPATVEAGLHHEQQHQELMLMDLKHAFWRNPLRPAYRNPSAGGGSSRFSPPLDWHDFEGGLQWIGHDGPGFAYDNETPRHREFVPPFQLADRLTTCGEYLEFIADDGYARPELWLSDGWKLVQERRWDAPLYWLRDGENWRVMTLDGLRPLNPAEPVCHVSYYEADAYARWRGAALPTEAAWEIAARDAPIKGNFLETDYLHPRPASGRAKTRSTFSNHQPPTTNHHHDHDHPRQMFGDGWEWTRSPYTAYPGFRPPAGALGEYNGKFMCNQMVLRGGACVTPRSHIRPTYRNFFPPEARWPFTALRLAKD